MPVSPANIANIPGGASAAAGNLRKGGVKPLRPVARPHNDETRRLSVEELKNGGTLDLSGVTAEKGTLRRRYASGTSRAARAKNSDLSLPERLEKLAAIKKSATEYETVFVDQLVKQMRPSPLAHTPGGDTFSEIAEQPFRDFLSRAGGLGLADSIVGQIARQEGLEDTLREHPEVLGPGRRLAIPPSLMKKSPGGLSLAPPEGAAPDPA